MQDDLIGALRVDGAWLLALKLLALPCCYKLLLQGIQRLLLLQQLGLHLLHLSRVALGHCTLMITQDCHLTEHSFLHIIEAYLNAR